MSVALPHRSWPPARVKTPPPTSNARAYLQQAAACQAAAIATRDRLTQSLLQEEASLWRMLASQSDAIASISRLLSDAVAVGEPPV